MNTKIEQEQAELEQVAAEMAEQAKEPQTEESAVTIAEPVDMTFAEYQTSSVTSIPGFEEFDKSDLVMPRYKLIQGTSRNIEGKDKLLGQWWNVLEEVAQEAPNIVILRYGRTRAMFEEKNFTPEGLLCMSTDGRTPNEQFDGRYSALCEECSCSKWAERVEGERVKPPCAAGYTFLCVDPNSGDMPFMMTWSGLANKKAKQLITRLLAKKRPAYSSFIHLGSKYEERKKGVFYLPVFAVLPMTDPAEVAKYRELFRAFASVQLEADEGVVNGESVGDQDQNDPNLPF